VKPYYQNDKTGIVLFHGDCREVLPTLARESVDLIVTDPPYGVNWNGTTRLRTSTLGSITGDDGTLDIPSIIGLALRTLTNHRHLYVFGRFDFSSLPIGGHAELIWDKEIPGPAAPAPWQYQHEYIYFGVKSRIPAGRAQGDGNGAARLRRGTVLRYKRPNALGAQRHPTEKPVPLLQELIESSSKPGETVLDLFAGSGSTLVAALLEGRKGIGIEIEEKYAEIAVRRLEQLQPWLLGLEQVQKRHGSLQIPMLSSVAAETDGDEVGREMRVLQPSKVANG
jgi:DNA modification methylase